MAGRLHQTQFGGKMIFDLPMGVNNLAIELTDDERRLAASIDFDHAADVRNADAWPHVADAMEELMRSLSERGRYSSCPLEILHRPGVFRRRSRTVAS